MKDRQFKVYTGPEGYIQFELNMLKYIADISNKSFNEKLEYEKLKNGMDKFIKSLEHNEKR